MDELEIADPANPTPDDVRRWARGELRQPTQDWDLMLAVPELIPTLVELIADERCPTRAYLLKALYIATPAALDELADQLRVAEAGGEPWLTTWAARTRHLIAHPEWRDGYLWHGGGHAQRPVDVPGDSGPVETALVLGGGGVAGIAWMTGLLAGLADAGHDVSDADLIIGTSAGAAVAAQVGSGVGLDDLYERQVDPARQVREIMADLDLEKFAAAMAPVLAGSPEPAEVRRRIGAMAMATGTGYTVERRGVIHDRLPSPDWPRRRIQLVAVDAVSGDPVRFDRDSHASMVAAVEASCAVPGIWPPVLIGGRHYVDGGVRSGENLDYAAGAARITVLAPTLAAPQVLPSEVTTPAVAEELRAGGASVVLIGPDEASVAAMGSNALDPSTRAPAAAAGRAQGRSLGAELAANPAS